MRDCLGRAIVAALLLLLIIPAIDCTGQQLQLIAPIPADTPQYRTDQFLVFFSPEIGEVGLEGLRFSLTNTTGNTLSIDWQESYFILPDGGWSDAITSDIPTSFQQSATEVSIRQTVEIVTIPLSNVAHSEHGWTIGVIEEAEGSEFTLHLVMEHAAETGIGTVTEGYDFTFRVVGGETDSPSIGMNLPVWSAFLALGVGFLLGLLLAAP